MGYWNTSPTGQSFARGVNEDGSEMLWGDAPADRIDEGVHAVITRLRLDLGRFPTLGELDEARVDAPEMAEAVAKARKVFAEDIEREATDAEVAAGLRFSDSGIALDSEIRADIKPGDVIRFALWRQDGDGWTVVDHTEDGVVKEIAERDAVNPWSGRTYTQVVYVVDRGGADHDVDREYASKVLPGDRSVEEENAAREQYRSKRNI